MSERTALVVLLVGTILVVASLLGISLVALTEGWLTMPADGIASTPYTAFGYLAGLVLIVAAMVLASLVRGPRRTARKPPARGHRGSAHRIQHVGAGRVYTSTRTRRCRPLPRAIGRVQVLPRGLDPAAPQTWTAAAGSSDDGLTETRERTWSR